MVLTPIPWTRFRSSAERNGLSRRASGGRAFTARDAAHLDAVYKHLGAKLARRTVHEPLEAGFAGAALVLLALGSAMSLRWFGRLI